MTPKLTHSQVARSLAELAQLWARPPDPEKAKPAVGGTTNGLGTETSHPDHTLVAPVKRGAP